MLVLGHRQPSPAQQPKTKRCSWICLLIFYQAGSYVCTFLSVIAFKAHQGCFLSRNKIQRRLKRAKTCLNYTASTSSGAEQTAATYVQLQALNVNLSPSCVVYVFFLLWYGLVSQQKNRLGECLQVYVKSLKSVRQHQGRLEFWVNSVVMIDGLRFKSFIFRRALQWLKSSSTRRGAFTHRWTSPEKVLSSRIFCTQ